MLGLFAVLLAIAIVPIWLVRLPPLVDYPNHLARMHILESENRSPLLNQYYEIHWTVLPNLGMDLVVPILAHVMPLETTGRLFLSLVLCLMASGTVALHVTLHRRWSLWPLLSFLFLYNSVFLWGFLNYLFGVGLALWGFAAWVAWRSGAAARIIPVFTMLATALFFSHIFALGFYGLLVAGFELGQWWTGAVRRPYGHWARALAQFLLPCALLLTSPLFDTNRENVPSWTRFEANPHGIEFAKPAAVLEAFKGTLRTENLALDRLTGLALMALVLGGAWTRRLSVLPAMIGPLGLVTLATWLMPANIVTGSYVEIRLPVALVLLAIASSDFLVRDPRKIAALAMVLCSLFAVRMSAITVHWREANRQYAEFFEAIEHVPPGSRIFSAIVKRGYGYLDFRIPTSIPSENLVCWAVISKSALVSIIFSAPNQQPLRLTQPYRRFFSTGEFMARSYIMNWEAVQEQYEYLLARQDERFQPPMPDGIAPLFAGRHFVLYRLPGSQPSPNRTQYRVPETLKEAYTHDDAHTTDRVASPSDERP
jgi:hypothetical protein